MNKKVALVLEGGGLRGAYTAGAMSWLNEHDINISSAYGISTGAWHLVCYLHNNPSLEKELSIKYISDKKYMGLKAFLNGEGVFSFKSLLKDLSEKTAFDLESIKGSKVNANIGLYNLKEGKTLYYNIKDINMNHMAAACSLPLLSKVVKIGDDEFLDGGITKMIPIEKAVEDNNDAFIIITTKPGNFVRKPSKKFVVWLMSVIYHKCKNISRDYAVRDKNYYDQINLIKKLESENKAVYRCPSKPSNVTRLKGTKEELEELYNLGYSDMEAIKDKIFELCK